MQNRFSVQYFEWREQHFTRKKFLVKSQIFDEKSQIYEI